MKKNIFMILGNGFSIDFISTHKRDNLINVRNLFCNGEFVEWPGNDEPGFLSYKYCPFLWNLGARPYIDNSDANELIENIITCANILQTNNREDGNNYVKAYKELSSYLMSLFIYYDKIIDFNEIDLSNWGWKSLFESYNNNDNIENVFILTYNYDVWLERVLIKLSINYSVDGFDKVRKKFHIFKPHGSISFKHDIQKDKDGFSINYDLDKTDINIKNFVIQYSDIENLNAVNAIIPPAGDSSRLGFTWAKNIRDNIQIKAAELNEIDELIICGISYWHVDRLEIDNVLTKINSKISNVKLINPHPPNVLNAVLTTLFENVIFFTNSKIFLGGI